MWPTMNKIFQQNSVCFFALMIALNTNCLALDFAGFYMGASLGYTTSSTQIDRLQLDNLSQAGVKMSSQAQNFAGFMGYGYLYNNKLYVGLEGKFGYTNYKGKYIHNAQFSQSLSHEIRNTYSFAGRAGWNVEQQTLLYVKGGFVLSETRLEACEYSDTHGKESWQKYVKGWEFGFGAEYALSENVRLGLEFTQVRHQSIRISVPEFANYKLQPHMNTIATRLSIRF